MLKRDLHCYQRGKDNRAFNNVRVRVRLPTVKGLMRQTSTLSEHMFMSIIYQVYRVDREVRAIALPGMSGLSSSKRECCGFRGYHILRTIIGIILD